MSAIWKTKDGRRLTPAEMTTEHITNTLAMLKRKGWVSVEEFEHSWACAFSLRGEMASYYAEQAASELKPASIIDALEEELTRRTVTRHL